VATPDISGLSGKFDVLPVLAQQSVRENTQTGRDYRGVIRDAAGRSSRRITERVRSGRRPPQVPPRDRDRLDAGVSMVTLDLSEKLDPEAFQAPADWVERKYREEIDEEESKVLFHLYLGKEFHLRSPQGECRIQYNEEAVKRNALLCHRAVDSPRKSMPSSVLEKETGLPSILRSRLTKLPSPRRPRTISSSSSN